MGHREVRSLVQSDELDEETRTELWNVLVLLREDLESGRADSQRVRVLAAVWERQLKGARDERPTDSRLWGSIKEVILAGPWFESLDMIEAIVKFLEAFPSPYDPERVQNVTDAYNNRFEYFLVGYRFIGHEITPVSSTAEAAAVSSAVDDVSGLAGARHHLERATDLLADRQAPDYPNSIKESISAVEAVVRKVTGAATLGKGLSKLESVGLVLHGSLKSAWQQMYGWTSDDDGIRHGGIEAANADQAMARYVLVTCSAFISYLVEEGKKTGLL